eukprot:2437191-Rhodomonas_salina.1
MDDLKLSAPHLFRGHGANGAIATSFDLRDTFGKTPLHIATAAGKVEVQQAPDLWMTVLRQRVSLVPLRLTHYALFADDEEAAGPRRGPERRGPRGHRMHSACCDAGRYRSDEGLA